MENYSFKPKTSDEWTRGGAVIVFDMPDTKTRRVYWPKMVRVVSRAMNATELPWYLEKIRSMGYKPVCVVRCKGLKS